MKQTLIWFNLQRDGTGNGLSNIKDTFAESFQLQISVLHQSMSIFKAGLSSQVHMMARQNVKKAPQGIPNSSLHNLKIYSSKEYRKTSQRWIICTSLTRTAILNIQIFSRRYQFRLWVFASTGAYFYYWHWRVLPNRK